MAIGACAEPDMQGIVGANGDAKAGHGPSGMGIPSGGFAADYSPLPRTQSASIR
jgi:hypothetical protein